MEYGIERTVQRIAVSKYADHFTLKGGMLLYALFDGVYPRVTTDIDFLAERLSNNIEDMTMIFREIFSYEADGSARIPVGYNEGDTDYGI